MFNALNYHNYELINVWLKRVVHDCFIIDVKKLHEVWRIFNINSCCPNPRPGWIVDINL